MRHQTIFGILTCLIILAGSIAGAGPVPDTGMYKCYDAKGNQIACPGETSQYFGQDGSYHINPQGFRKLDNDGRVVSDATANWTMVKDTVTELIWEVKTDDDTIHDVDKEYIYDEASDYVTTLNAENFGGINTWRLPTAKELVFIGTFGQANALNTDFFGPYRSGNRNFWSSTHGNQDLSKQYVVDASDAEWMIIERGFENSVRAVFGPDSGSDFKDNGNGTVTDRSTGLTWQKDALKVNDVYKLSKLLEGADICEELDFAGLKDWRLPTIKELISIIDLEKYDPAIDLDFFSGDVFNNGVKSVFWSSTVDPTYTLSGKLVDFKTTSIGSLYHMEFSSLLRAVRGGYFGLADIKITVSETGTGNPIQGAAVFLETVETETDKTGIAVFNNVSNGRYFIKVEAPGYVTHRTVVSLAGIPDDVDLAVSLTPERGSDNPLVVSVNTPYDNGGSLYFIQGINFDVTFSAIVDWGSKIQGRVLFNQNGSIQGNYPNSVEYRTYHMGSFSGGLTVTAKSLDGTASDPVSPGIEMIPPPPGFQAADLQLSDLGSDYAYTAEVTATGGDITTLIDATNINVPAGIPVFGGNPLAAEAMVNIAVSVGSDGVAEYTFSANADSYVAAAGITTTAGDSDSDWTVVGTARCRYESGGWVFDAGEELHSTLNHSVAPEAWVGSVDVGEFDAPLVLTPALQAVIDSANPITDLISGTTWDLSGTLKPEHAAYFASGNHLSSAVTLETWLGMDAFMAFNFDASPTFQDAFAAVGGDVVATELFYQHRHLEWGYAWSKDNSVASLSGSVPTVAPIDRDSYTNGGETSFQQSASESAIYCQSDVYPYSDPAFSADGNLMVWVGDETDAVDENRTSLFFSERSGDGWSAPAAVTGLIGPDFNPNLVTTGSDSAAMVWQHAADGWGTDLADLRSAQEIWFADYQGVWSDPVQLSDNDTYDHSPVVAFTGDERLAVWINETLGGAQSIMYATGDSGTWSAAIQAFTPENMVTFLTLAFDENTDSYRMVYSVDGDGNPEAIGDQELYSRVYRSGTGWAASTRLTNNSTQDTCPRLVEDSSGNLWLFWYADGEIRAVEDLNSDDFMGSSIIAASPGKSAGGADFTVVPDGADFHVLWSKPSAVGQEITGLLFSPGGGSSSPVMLTSGGGMKRSLAGAMRAGGNLIIAYNQVGITGQDQEILIGGSTYNLSVPEAGVTSLCTNFYPLQKKLTLTIANGTGAFSFAPAPIAQQGDIRYYDAGTAVSITPDNVLSDGWYFHHWTGDIGTADPADNPLSIVMEDDKEIQGVFEPLFHMSVIKYGSGTVTLNPAGGFYEPGTRVTLTAEPGDGYMFDAWYGDAVGTRPSVTITMDGNKDVIAQFVPQYILTRQVVPTDGGYIQVNPEGPYQRNAVVYLTAVPADGYVFDHWSGAVTGSTNPISITMTSNKSVTAYFTENVEYTLNLTRYGSGTVVANPAGPNYDPGTQVTLTATPSTGYTFTGWGGDASGTVTPLTITMNSDKNISATFEYNSVMYSLTVLTSAHGSIFPGSGTYSAGQQIGLTAEPDPGYKLGQWTGDASGSGSQNPIFLWMDGNKTVGAEFVGISLNTLTVNVTGNGTVSPGSGQYPANEQVVLTATPDAGNTFLGWQGDVPPDAGVSPVIGVTMTGNKTVTANFSGASSYSLTVTDPVNGMVDVDPPGPDYVPGTTVTLTATPDPGYLFSGWDGGLTGNPATLVMNTNHTVTANFEAFIPALYYPHVECRSDWETEICTINTGAGDIAGEFSAYDESGILVSSIDASLSSLERVEMNVGTAFDNPEMIRYIIFNATGDADTLAGYTKFFRPGIYRAALPAVSAMNTGAINIPHIASGGKWWTGIALINTTSADKNNVTLEFNTGETQTVDLPAGSYKAFTISSLFGGADCSDLLSAVIPDGDGLIGLELFGDREPAHLLSGILLTDERVTALYYPHVESTNNWWTGINAFNPADADCDMTIRPYQENGVALPLVNETIPGRGKYSGTVNHDLDLPEDTAWVAIEASHGITGFELFGQPYKMAGFSANRMVHNAGVFCKIDNSGERWSGISIVNTSDTLANVTFRAMDDSGNEIETVAKNFDPHQKWVGSTENMFAGDISAATYMTFESDVPVAGFLLSQEGSGTNWMLDGLPAMAMGDQPRLVALPDEETVKNGYWFEPVTMDVLANDHDPDGDSLEIVSITSEYNWNSSTPFEVSVEDIANATESGCFTIRTDKKAIIFDLGGDHKYDTGTATCTYTISNGNGKTAVSTLTVMVEAEISTPF